MKRGIRTRKLGRHDESATAGIVGFIVAIAVFTMSFYYITQASLEREADTSAASSYNVQSKAEALADVFLQSGAGWYSGPPCTVVDGEKTVDSSNFDPDGVSDSVDGAVQGRFGLGEESCVRDPADRRAKNNLSYAKILNLNSAAMDEDSANGYVDYEEARKSLGLADGEDFHIRSAPVLATVREILAHGYKDPLMRPLYIGDYSDPSGIEETVDYSYSVTDGSDRVTIRLTITNDGLDAAIFATFFEIPLDRNNVGFTLHTPLLATDEAHTIEFTLRKSADWEWDDPSEKWITFDISDRDGSVGDGTISLSGIDMDYVLTQTNVFAESDKMYWEKDGNPSVTIKMNYMAFEGDGEKKKFSDWTLVTTDPLGVPMVALPLTNNVFDGVSSQTAVIVGAYKGDIKNDLLLASWNFDHMNVVEDESEVHSYHTVAGSTYVPAESVAVEAGYLEALVHGFDNGVFSSIYDSTAVPYVAEGDIFPDVKDVMNNDLVDALTDANGDPSYEYNMVAVGSNVDHTVMTSASAKYAIRDWVLGGGTLLVFGSDDQSIQWLQPLFHASLETANGGLQTPDEGHPVLNVPNDLDYLAYEYSTQWGYSSGAEESFTHVISTGAGGDVLAVGNPGSFGEGRVLLSSWRPYKLLPAQDEVCSEPYTQDDDCEALFLMHNVMTLSYRYLYIDFGPEIPTNADVGSTLRIVNVYHPELREVVSLQFQVFVFD